MSPRRTFGSMLFGAAIGILFSTTAISVGWRTAVIVWSCAIGLTALIVLALWLIIDD